MPDFITVNFDMAEIERRMAEAAAAYREAAASLAEVGRSLQGFQIFRAPFDISERPMEPGFESRFETSFYPISESSYEWSDRTPAEQAHYQAVESPVNYTFLSWEDDFVLERQEPYDLILFERMDRQYDGYKYPEGRRIVLEYTLRELAALLPAGVLGLHQAKDWRDTSLLIRAKEEYSPLTEWIKSQGWFAVRGVETVLWAPASLENYNTLCDSGLTFEQSKKVQEWLDRVTVAPGQVQEWPDDCPLFDYQKEGVEFLNERKRAMLSLSPGLGKTLTSAYAAASDPNKKKVLLVCPASLLHYWRSELAKWSPKLPQRIESQVWHRGTGEIPEEVPDGVQYWVITNPETLKKHMKNFFLPGKKKTKTWDLLVVDESIMFKHRQSERSQKLGEAVENVENVWLLTGAPATRFLDDMWHQFHLLNQRAYASYWRFANRYCVVNDNPWAKTVVANKREAEEEVKRNYADVYFARNQDQVMDIPDWLMEDIDIAMMPKQEAVYDKLQKEMLIKLGEAGDDDLLVANRLSLILRSLQVASNPVLVGSENSSGKWNALNDLFQLYPGPYILWVNFIRTGEMMKEFLDRNLFSDRVTLVNGATPMKERNQEVTAFQDGRYDVIILNNQVGKFGFTLTKARTAIFLERGYDDSYFQCLFRNRRIGTTQSPIVLNLRSVYDSGKHTIDHVVHDALDYRNRMIKKITVGDLRKNIIG